VSDGVAAPFPDGWFRVAASADLPRGAVRPLRYFGRDLVAFRTAGGVARVLDAHCPHLGAHLGHGGCVEGDAIRCPFHGWLIGGDGRCLAVPRGRQAPRAAIRTWPVREVNSLVMVYHHARAEKPAWEVPEMPELASREWTRWRPGPRWRIRCHIQDIAENGIDTAHMPLVHGNQTRAIASETLETRGPTLVHRMDHEYQLFPLARWLGARVRGPLEITYHGLGCAVNRALVEAGPRLRYLFLFTFTPIDERHVEVTSILSMKKLGNPLATWLLARKAIREGGRTIDQDVPIFEHKIHRPDPPLTDADGPIMQYRRWAAQFYSEPAVS
jgi:phenylpropionate dioxygenase-like ring-hydroxylating dioxygenase large terminal subunit